MAFNPGQSYVLVRAISLNTYSSTGFLQNSMPHSMNHVHGPKQVATRRDIRLLGCLCDYKSPSLGILIPVNRVTSHTHAGNRAHSEIQVLHDSNISANVVSVKLVSCSMNGSFISCERKRSASSKYILNL